MFLFVNSFRETRQLKLPCLVIALLSLTLELMAGVCNGGFGMGLRVWPLFEPQVLVE